MTYQWDESRPQPQRVGVIWAIIILLGMLGVVGGCVSIVWGLLVGFGVI